MNVISRGISGLKTLVRTRVSPRMTTLYAKAGFADRDLLTNDLQALSFPDHNYALNLLTSQGIIKSRFRTELSSLADIESYMLSGHISSTRLDNLGLPGLVGTSYLDHDSSEVVRKVAFGINRGIEHVGESYLFKKGIETLPFAVGIAGAIAIGMTLSGAWGLAILGGASAISYAAIKSTDIFPTTGFYSFFGKLARGISTKAAPLVFGADGIFIGHSLFESNLHVPSLCERLGMTGTIAAGAAILGTMVYFVVKNIVKMNRSYGQHITPGKRLMMGFLIGNTALSTAGEIHYIGTRTLLLGAASSYLFMNTLAALPLGVALWPLGIPLAGLLLGGWLRSRAQTTFPSAEVAKASDSTKIYTPYLGFLYGLGGAAVASAGALALGWGAAGLIPVIAYSTLYGSLGTLFLSELHGSFHTINTSFGALVGMQTSAIDPIGLMEQQRRARAANIFLINPHTGGPEGPAEHTLGLYFTVKLNKSPGAFFVCMFDRILSEVDKKKKTFNNLDIQVAERDFIAWLQQDQREDFARLAGGLDDDFFALPLNERYLRLATNLEALANRIDGEAEQKIRDLIDKKAAWFDKLTEVAEYRRAAFQEMSNAAEELRAKAAELRRMEARGYVAEDYLEQEWNYYLGCHDPETVDIVPITRKSIYGDEREVRKVENVGAVPKLAGTSIYMALWKETPDAPTFVEDLIPGTWTRVKNPNFSYVEYFRRPFLDEAKQQPNPRAAKYLWVPTTTVLSDLQRENFDKLSNSQYVASVENKPDPEHEIGFVPGRESVTIKAYGHTVEVTDYFLAPIEEPRKVPTVKSVNYRAGQKKDNLPPGYMLATQTPIPAEVARVYGPITFTIPHFDYAVMMDKNDIEVKTTVLLPALLDREKANTFINLLFRYPVEEINGRVRIVNPHPEKELDLSQGIQVVESNVELSYVDDQQVEHLIPYKPDRGAVHVGIDDYVRWVLLREAYVETDARGNITLFQLRYNKGIELKDLAFLGDKQAVVWAELRKQNIIDPNGGVISGSLAGRTLNIDPDSQTKVAQLLAERAGFKVLTLPPSLHPGYFPQLEVGPNAKLKLSVNNFTLQPQREGDMSWAWIRYQDGTSSFSRIPDGRRPNLFNKDLRGHHHG